jgi:hypothetical protein
VISEMDLIEAALIALETLPDPPEGPPGPQGEQGPPGDDGAVGPVGPIGVQGPIGRAGKDGQDGAPGPTGVMGPLGPVGPRGQQGWPGPIGPEGEKGEKGERGPAGPAGHRASGFGGGGGIAPGGDKILVQSGGVPVGSVTAINFEGATVEVSAQVATVSGLGGGGGTVGLGGGGGIVTVETIDITFDTPGLNNPSDSGPVLFTVAAGRLFRVVCLITTDWDQAGTLGFVAGENSTNAALQCGIYDAIGARYDAFVVMESYVAAGSPPDLATFFPRIPVWVYSLQTAVVCAAFFPAGADPTAGAATVKLLVVAP